MQFPDELTNIELDFDMVLMLMTGTKQLDGQTDMGE
eukprot:CAMPEP_0116911156 /NCGR_PEP_ID=MMETSP0467-20121206/15314_1 /TAXON_ID=283647 /ORGANISM="Mesodinium pulex, Strain SPMC105" /LENGTH=35 /DNA_ID= /DNA_START= /DNA_END= /DNA_ORIENTATION=